MSDTFDHEDSAADIAIVGLGPGGLTAALKAAKNGKKVVAFTDKDHIRGQRLLINEETVRILTEFRDETDAEDIKFWRRFSNEGTIQTKDIEKYLYRKLSAFPNVTIVKINKDSIESIGSDNQNSSAAFIRLKDGAKYYCHNIVASDGARHNLATIAARDLSEQITYGPGTFQDRHKYHAAVLLKLKRGEELPITVPQPIESEAKIQIFRGQGWEQDYEPNCYVCCNEKQTKFNFTGAIPESIFRAPYEVRRELLHKWASEVIFQKYGIKPEQLEYRSSTKSPEKDRLQANVFELEIIICQKPVLSLPGGGFFTLIGDARRTPYYRVGHGLNDAVKGGYSFALTLEPSPHGINIEEYTNLVRSMDKYVDDRMSAMPSTLQFYQTTKTVDSAPTQNVNSDMKVLK